MGCYRSLPVCAAEEDEKWLEGVVVVAVSAVAAASPREERAEVVRSVGGTQRLVLSDLPPLNYLAQAVLGQDPARPTY